MTRQEAAAKAREVCWQKALKGEIQFYNFHYQLAWERFAELNISALEAEDDQEHLVQFIMENDAVSRVISNGYQPLVQLLTQEIKDYGLLAQTLRQILSKYEYRILAKLMLYAWLTVLQRIKQNYLTNLTDMPSDRLNNMFCFILDGGQATMAVEEQEWIKSELYQNAINIEAQAEALAGFLGISREEALLEIEEERP